ncbi:MAG: tRNA (guanine-N7)-methyltransferase [SAR86 cluster bacterium]|uniref:tRNA (guanine-N(7)-)-methyltransferase n=1 Tax=SAR86 cluster bacterium TaxID=2030880 RepID=A0A368BTJ0_9GAMM|nr:MAG: tRNA (guanine-N7)-methyltransferase [SAR86 cluster bacterium]
MNKQKKYLPSFVKRLGRITAAQKANLNDLDLYKTKIKDLKNKNVVLDIGFGNGEYTAAYANAFQEKHLIATEVYLSGIGSLIGLINKNKILNISIFDVDVRLLMDQMPKEFLDSVNILFPDPWQKAKHHKRRLIGEDFLYQLHPLLKPNAKIFVRTDWEDYAEQIRELAEVMSSHFRLERIQNIEFEFKTRFHQRAIKEGREISSFLFTKL